MKKIIFILALHLLFIPSGHAFNASNFDSPESIIVDPEEGSYYVSNINGDFAAKDGNGYISKIDPTGKTVIQKFIGSKLEESTLNAPKGLMIVGRNLFVTDIDMVRGFDKETGKPTVAVDLSKLGAKFLNDITVDGKGFIYVSDTMANRIYKIDTNRHYETEIFMDSPDLGMPNGLLINPKSKHLIVVTYGSGRILEIDRAKKIHVVKRGLSTLDGVDYDNKGNLYVSSFEKGEIYKISYYGRGTLTTSLSGLTTPADISFDLRKNELLVPSMKGETVATYSVKEINKKNHF